MKNIPKVCSFWLFFFVFVNSALSQQIEYIDGVKHIRNDKPLWGKEQKVGLELVQTIGGLDVSDENYLMFEIMDVEADDEGNIYILDTGQQRVQKFDKKGKYKQTLGSRGQGPAEFTFPVSVNVDHGGNVYVIDGLGQNRIVVLDSRGKEIRRFTVKRVIDTMTRFLGPEKLMFSNMTRGFFGGAPLKARYLLFSIHDLEGNELSRFGEPEFTKLGEGDRAVYNVEGRVYFEKVSDDDFIYTAYTTKNKIEKRDLEGNIIFSADRKLNFKPTKYEKRTEDRPTQKARLITRGLGIDQKKRIWIATVTKQHEKWERMNPVRSANAEFEIFSSEGILLGKVPLPEDMFQFRIKRDRLFIIGYDRISVSEYRIVEQ